MRRPGGRVYSSPCRGLLGRRVDRPLQRRIISIRSTRRESRKLLLRSALAMIARLVMLLFTGELVVNHYR